MASTLRVLYKDFKTGQIREVTNDVSVGFNDIASADTQSDNISMVVKSKLFNQLQEPYTIFQVIVTDEDGDTFDRVYLYQSDQQDDLNTATLTPQTETYTKQINLIEPLAFLNEIPCPDTASSLPAVDSPREVFTYRQVLERLLEKIQYSNLFVLDATMDFLEKEAPEFKFEDKTLRQCVDVVYSAVGEVPKIILSDINDQVPLLSNVKKVTEPKIITTFTREGTSQTQSAITATKTLLQKGLGTTIKYPLNGLFFAPTSTEKIKQETSSSLYFELPQPINKLKNVTAWVTHNAFGDSSYKVGVRTYKIPRRAGLEKSFSDVINEIVPGIPETRGGNQGEKFPVVLYGETQLSDFVGGGTKFNEFIVTKEDFDAKLIEERADLLFYEIGGDRIDGLTTNEDFDISIFDKPAMSECLQSAIRTQVSGINEYSLTREVGELTYDRSDADFDYYTIEIEKASADLLDSGTNTRWSYLDQAQWHIAVEYEPQVDVQLDLTNADTTEKRLQVTKFDNVSSFIDLDSGGREAFYKLSILDPKAFTVTQRTTKLSEIAEPTQPVTDEAGNTGNVIRRSITFNKNEFIVKYDLSPKFIIIPSESAINNAPRQFASDPSQAVSRTDIFINNVLVTGDDRDLPPDRSIFTFKLFERIFGSMVQTLPNVSGYRYKEEREFKPSGADVDTIQPFNRFQAPISVLGFGNVISYYLHLNSTRILTQSGRAKTSKAFTEDSKQSAVNAYEWTDQFGEFDSFIIFDLYGFGEYFSTNGSAQNEPAHYYPDISKSTSGNQLSGYKDDSPLYRMARFSSPIIKDAQESYSLAGQLNFEVIGGSALIYPAFTSRNVLVTGKTVDVAYRLLDNKPTGLEIFVNDLGQAITPSPVFQSILDDLVTWGFRLSSSDDQKWLIAYDQTDGIPLFAVQVGARLSGIATLSFSFNNPVNPNTVGVPWQLATVPYPNPDIREAFVEGTGFEEWTVELGYSNVGDLNVFAVSLVDGVVYRQQEVAPGEDVFQILTVDSPTKPKRVRVEFYLEQGGTLLSFAEDVLPS